MNTVLAHAVQCAITHVATLQFFKRISDDDARRTVVEATERLEQRILLALLKQPRPIDWFGNALQGKALSNLTRRGWVHLTSGKGPNGTPDERLLVLTNIGRERALDVCRRRKAARERVRKARRRR